MFPYHFLFFSNPIFVPNLLTNVQLEDYIKQNVHFYHFTRLFNHLKRKIGQGVPKFFLNIFLRTQSDVGFAFTYFIFEYSFLLI